MSINISRNQLEYTMSQFNEMLEYHIIEDVTEFNFLNTVTEGFTPNIRINFRTTIKNIITNLIGNNHPIIIERLSNNIMISLESSIKALYSIRSEDTFTSIEIKNYLYNHLKYLLNYDDDSFISNYVII
jgi:hypothetical protein